MFITLFIENAKSNIIAKMFLMTLCEKIVPIYVLYTMYNYKANSLHFQSNVYFTVGLFFLYLTFLYSQNTNFYEVYEGIVYSIKNDDNNTPFFLLAHKLLGL